MDKHLLCASLAAAGGKDEALSRNGAQTFTGNERYGKADVCFFRTRNKCAARNIYIRLRDLIHIALDILRTRKALAEGAKAEAVVYALLKHTAEALLALDDEHLGSAFARRGRSRKTGRAAAYHDNIVIMHCLRPPFCSRTQWVTARSSF